MKRFISLLLTAIVLLPVSRVMAQDALLTDLMKEAGAATYAGKDNYGGGIQNLYLGYDADNKPVIGVATRETKTYSKVTAVMAIVPDGDAYKISAAEVPGIDAMPGKSGNYTKDALKDITGKVIPDSAEAKGLVDAVSGATKHYKAIYISYSLMAAKVIEEMKANPDWERKALP
ncbi:MAG: hypothetical protein EOM20_07080 [Spartobacteria bacterium]|nr:hypothetical protein [Spartobacteria bacterium]